MVVKKGLQIAVAVSALLLGAEVLADSHVMTKAESCQVKGGCHCKDKATCQCPDSCKCDKCKDSCSGKQ